MLNIISHQGNAMQNPSEGTSLVVQWIRLCTPNAGAVGLIPDQETRSCMPQFKIPLKLPQVAAKDTGTAKKKHPTVREFPGRGDSTAGARFNRCSGN